jgi:hypothetical protein
MAREVPFADAFVVIFENDVIEIGNLVAPKIHCGNKV